MFPGDSCYPISPKHRDAANADIISRNDQLIVILKALKDTISEQDLCFITSDDPRHYAQHLVQDMNEK